MSISPPLPSIRPSGSPPPLVPFPATVLFGFNSRHNGESGGNNSSVLSLLCLSVLTQWLFNPVSNAEWESRVQGGRRNIAQSKTHTNTPTHTFRLLHPNNYLHVAARLRWLSSFFFKGGGRLPQWKVSLRQRGACSMSDRTICIIYMLRGYVILMPPNGVLRHFHIKAEQRGSRGRYKILKLHNCNSGGQTTCLHVCVFVLLMPYVVALLSLVLNKCLYLYLTQLINTVFTVMFPLSL